MCLSHASVMCQLRSLCWADLPSRGVLPSGVSECDRDASTVTSSWLTGGCRSMEQKISTVVHNDNDLSDFYTVHIYTHHN